MKGSRLIQLGLMVVVASIFGCVALDPVPTEERVFNNVREVDLKKNEIYKRSLEWLARSFTDSKEVIEIKDPEGGKIVGKGVTEFVNIASMIPCRFTLTIDIKDGKYRTSYENFTAMWGEYRNQPMPLEHRPHFEQVMAKILQLDSDLYEFVATAPKTDW